MKQNRADYTVL